jgi:hypothetical protein
LKPVWRMFKWMDAFGDRLVTDVLQVLPGRRLLFAMSLGCWAVFATGTACLYSPWAQDSTCRCSLAPAEFTMAAGRAETYARLRYHADRHCHTADSDTVVLP